MLSDGAPWGCMRCNFPLCCCPQFTASLLCLELVSVLALCCNTGSVTTPHKRLCCGFCWEACACPEDRRRGGKLDPSQHRCRERREEEQRRTRVSRMLMILRTAMAAAALLAAVDQASGFVSTRRRHHGLSSSPGTRYRFASDFCWWLPRCERRCYAS